MDVYGLTGGIGSGKSTVAGLLEDYGVPVVSADELSRIVVSPGSEGLRQVAEEFGSSVIAEDGTLDRAKLAGIVFADPAKRRRLEEILHPRIRERFEQVLDALEKAGHEVAVYEVPLLFEKDLQGDMKAVMLVTAPEAVRVRRVCARDNVTETEVRARIAAQMPESQKRKRADYIIENDGNVDALRREVEFLLARFLRVSGVIKRGPANDEVEVSPTEIPRDHSLPLTTGAPSRAPTQLPGGAPVRTGQTLPPPGGEPLAPPSSAATLVAGAASSVPPDPSGPIVTTPMPGTTLPSTPIVAVDEPVLEHTLPPTSRPPGAPVAIGSDPSTSSRPAIARPTPTPTPTPPTAPSEAPAAIVPSLKKPPKAPPLRKPTEARAKTPPPPATKAESAPPPPPGSKRASADLKKKPAAPPIAKPPAPAGTGTAKQTVVGTAPPPPPTARPKTERMAAVPTAPATSADEEPA